MKEYSTWQVLLLLCCTFLLVSAGVLSFQGHYAHATFDLVLAHVGSLTPSRHGRR